MRIAGVPATEPDARGIVTTLVSDGNPKALDLANRNTTRSSSATATRS